MVILHLGTRIHSLPTLPFWAGEEVSKEGTRVAMDETTSGGGSKCYAALGLSAGGKDDRGGRKKLVSSRILAERVLDLQMWWTIMVSCPGISVSCLSPFFCLWTMLDAI